MRRRIIVLFTVTLFAFANTLAANNIPNDYQNVYSSYPIYDDQCYECDDQCYDEYNTYPEDGSPIPSSQPYPAPCPPVTCAPCMTCAPCAPVCGTECGISICAIGVAVAALAAAAALIVASGNGATTTH